MAEFDIDAARKSGATDDQILDYLSKRSPNFDVQGALKSAPKQDVISYLAKNSTPPQISTTSNVKAAPKEWTVPWLKERLYNVADSLTEGLPAAGATAGALVGGGSGVLTGGTTSVPGAIGGAGMGGMAGEALKQHVRRALGFEVPQTSEDAAKEITKQGVIQGGTQAVTEALPMLAGPIKKAATSQYERALAPTTKINKAITKKIAPEMMDRGVHGSIEGIEDLATQKAASITPKLNAAYSQIPEDATKGSGDQILNSLEKMKGKYLVNGKVANPQAVNAIEGVQEIIKQHGADISPDSLRQLKSIFDETVAQKGGYAGSDLATQFSLKAQKAASNRIRSILSSASPDVAELNKEVSLWLNVQKVAKDSGLRQTGQQGGLLKTFGPMAAGLATAGGVATHAGATTSLEVGALSSILTGIGIASRTPRWRTASALFKNSLADSLASGNVGRATSLLSRLGVAIPEATQASDTSGQTATQ